MTNDSQESNSMLWVVSIVAVVGIVAMVIGASENGGSSHWPVPISSTQSVDAALPINSGGFATQLPPGCVVKPCGIVKMILGTCGDLKEFVCDGGTVCGTFTGYSTPNGGGYHPC
jgi:hypothetical protein